MATRRYLDNNTNDVVEFQWDSDIEPTDEDIEEIKKLKRRKNASINTLNNNDEPQFQNWYKEKAEKTGLSLNPDEPEHKYDYRAAYKAGVEPEYVKDADNPGYYWPSQFKQDNNARRYLTKAENGADIATSGRAYDTKNNNWVDLPKKTALSGAKKISGDSRSFPEKFLDKAGVFGRSALANTIGDPWKIESGEEPGGMAGILSGFINDPVKTFKDTVTGPYERDVEGMKKGGGRGLLSAATLGMNTVIPGSGESLRLITDPFLDDVDLGEQEELVGNAKYLKDTRSYNGDNSFLDKALRGTGALAGNVALGKFLDAPEKRRSVIKPDTPESLLSNAEKRLSDRDVVDLPQRRLESQETNLPGQIEIDGLDDFVGKKDFTPDPTYNEMMGIGRESPWKVEDIDLPEMPSKPNVGNKLRRILLGEDVDLFDSLPSKQTGAVGDLGPLNKFRDSQYRKYGKDWEVKQSVAEAEFHKKLMGGSEDVSYSTPEEGKMGSLDIEEPVKVEPKPIFDPMTKSVDKGRLDELLRKGGYEPQEPTVKLSPEDIAVDLTDEIRPEKGKPQWASQADEAPIDVSDQIGKKSLPQEEPTVTLPDEDVAVDLTDKIRNKPKWASQENAPPINVTEQIKVLDKTKNEVTPGDKSHPILDTVNFVKSLRYAGDIPGMRQTWWQSISHPYDTILRKGSPYKRAIRSYVSEKAFNAHTDELKNTTYKVGNNEINVHDLMKNSGLQIIDDLDQAHSPSGEIADFYGSRAAGHLPHVRAGERATVSLLNEARKDNFMRMAKPLLDGGMKLDDPLFKGIADAVNDTSGTMSQGKLGVNFDRALPYLNTVLGSTKLQASRLRTMYGVANSTAVEIADLFAKGKIEKIATYPKPVRKALMKDFYLRIVPALGTVYGIAKLTGHADENDIRSSDFGKIKSGDRRFDIGNGYIQYLRLAAEMATGKKKTLSGKLTGAFDRKKPIDQQEDFRFVRNKLNPLAGEAVSSRLGTTGKLIKNPKTGKLEPEEWSFGGALRRSVEPIPMENIREVVQEMIRDGEIDKEDLFSIPLDFWGIGSYELEGTNKKVEKKSRLSYLY